MNINYHFYFSTKIKEDSLKNVHIKIYNVNEKILFAITTLDLNAFLIKHAPISQPHDYALKSKLV